MKSKIIIFAILLSLFEIRLSAQIAPPDTVWTVNVAPQSYRTLNCGVFDLTADSGFVISSNFPTHGVLDNILLFKTDNEGSLQWVQNYLSNNTVAPNYVFTESDGGYLITGTYKSYAGFNYDKDVLLLKADNMGNQLWFRFFDVEDANDMGTWVEETPDGGYIVCGNAHTPSLTTQAYLLKTDSLGFTQWEHLYGTSFCWEKALCVKRTSDSGYIIVGDRMYSGSDYYGYIVKTSPLGYLQWEKEFGDSTNDQHFNSVFETEDNNFIIAGSKMVITGQYGQYDFILTKTDNLGNVIWSKTYGDAELSEYCYYTTRTLDNGFLLIGNYSSDSRTILIKVDYLGNLQWQNTYNIMRNSTCVKQLNDGSIIFSYCRDFEGSSWRIMLAKLEPDPILNSSFISASSDSLNFEQISLGDSSSTEITIINTGYNLLTIYELIVEEPFTDQIISGSELLEFGDSAIVRVSFSPINLGLYASNLNIISDADNADTLEVYLEGEGVITGVSENSNEKNIPNLAYFDIIPNPFNASTAITFDLPVAAEIDLAVFDIQGRMVQSLVTGHSSLGNHSVVWDASGQASGVYFVKLMVDGRWTMVRKIVLMK